MQSCGLGNGGKHFKEKKIIQLNYRTFTFTNNATDVKTCYRRLSRIFGPSPVVAILTKIVNTRTRLDGIEYLSVYLSLDKKYVPIFPFVYNYMVVSTTFD